MSSRWLRRRLGDLRFWWRTSRRVNAWTPGQSKLERMRALDRELVLVVIPPADSLDEHLRALEDGTRDAELIVRVTVH